ncbi:MAG: leucine-rich repeat domain-containing protein [Oscillospiraceae bacterium]|nr:leucine-rich repeat domain-containing protein [Oscillospiraceae bacterium]
MKTWQKVVFIAVLVCFVSASITISLISVSRAPYKYSEETAIGGDESLNGWIFYGFNGNAGTKTLNIDYVRDREGNDPDLSKPVLGIREYAVNADENAEELHIGASVQYIDEYAFYNAKKLQKITVDPDNQWYKDVDGVLFTKDGKVLILYPVCYGQQPTEKEDEFTYPDAYTVPDGVERINNFAFLKNGHLRDVTLPDSLKEIGVMAFFDCGRLGSYDYDAANDSLLGTGFTLPDGIEKIGSDAFSKCGNISPCLFLPASVKEVDHHAFFSCGGMKEILMGAADETGVSLGESWLPKNIKVGAAWKAPKAQYGKTRKDSEDLIEAFREEKLNGFREEAAKNG